MLSIIAAFNQNVRANMGGLVFAATFDYVAIFLMIKYFTGV